MLNELAFFNASARQALPSFPSANFIAARHRLVSAGMARGVSDVFWCAAYGARGERQPTPRTAQGTQDGKSSIITETGAAPALLLGFARGVARIPGRFLLGRQCFLALGFFCGFQLGLGLFLGLPLQRGGPFPRAFSPHARQPAPRALWLLLPAPPSAQARPDRRPLCVP